MFSDISPLRLTNGNMENFPVKGLDSHRFSYIVAPHKHGGHEMNHVVCKPPVVDRKTLSAAQLKRSETKHNQKVRKAVKWAAPELSLGN